MKKIPKFAFSILLIFQSCAHYNAPQKNNDKESRRIFNATQFAEEINKFNGKCDNSEIMINAAKSIDFQLRKIDTVIYNGGIHHEPSMSDSMYFSNEYWKAKSEAYSIIADAVIAEMRKSLCVKSHLIKKCSGSKNDTLDSLLIRYNFTKLQTDSLMQEIKIHECKSIEFYEVNNWYGGANFGATNLEFRCKDIILFRTIMSII